MSGPLTSDSCAHQDISGLSLKHHAGALTKRSHPHHKLEVIVFPIDHKDALEFKDDDDSTILLTEATLPSLLSVIVLLIFWIKQGTQRLIPGNRVEHLEGSFE